VLRPFIVGCIYAISKSPEIFFQVGNSGMRLCVEVPGMQIQVAVLAGQSVVLIAQLFRDIQKTLILHGYGIRDYSEAVGITTRAIDLIPDRLQLF
jgi:hypothetical protein